MRWGRATRTGLGQVNRFNKLHAFQAGRGAAQSRSSRMVGSLGNTDLLGWQTPSGALGKRHRAGVPTGRKALQCGNDGRRIVGSDLTRDFNPKRAAYRVNAAMACSNCVRITLKSTSWALVV